jgi:hypothetical protein
VVSVSENNAPAFLSSNTPPPPEWVEKEAQEITGLDLLGLRAPVNAIGYAFLDGVTTISPMVRYIALRAWTTHLYLELRLPDSRSDFLEFATRVEAAVVIGNLLDNPNAAGLIGSEAGQKIVEEGARSIELRPLVKQPATNIYLGPSTQIGVAFQREKGIAGLTEERGLPLAELLDESLAGTAFAKKLRKNPKIEKLSREELEEVGAAFPIDSPSKKEREFLLSAILPARPRSEEEANRAISYGILLEIASEAGKIEELDILDYAINPDCALLPKYTKWLDGWACYLIRDMLAVVHECAFAAMLYGLQEAGGDDRAAQGLGLLSAMLGNDAEIKASLKGLDLLPKGRKPLDAPLSELARLVDELTVTKRRGMIPRWEGLGEQDVIDAAWDEGIEALAMLPVAWLLAQARVGKGEDNQQILTDYLSVQGWARIGLEQVVLPGLNDMLRRGITIREAMGELAMRTMDQHVRIAWSRLAVDPRRDVASLTVDGDMWSLRKGKEFRAGRTASRLIQAIGWLRQLGLVDNKGCTEEGKRHLDRVRSLVDNQGGEE